MFDGGQTENIILEKLLPVLEELARAEFGAYSTSGNVDHESAKLMKNSEQAMEELIQGYLRGLLNLHLSYGYQYEQTEEKKSAALVVALRKRQISPESVFLPEDSNGPCEGKKSMECPVNQKSHCL